MNPQPCIVILFGQCNIILHEWSIFGVNFNSYVLFWFKLVPYDASWRSTTTKNCTWHGLKKFHALNRPFGGVNLPPFHGKIKNVKKWASKDTETAPIRSNIVRMGHKIEGKKFRPICGQLSKESSLLCTQSKIEAKRPKQRFLAGRAVGCDFPNFWDFTKKFRLREIFWHTFDKFWPFGCRATSKRKKNITWLWGAPRSQLLISTSRNWSQKIFLSKNYKISPGQPF